MPGIIDLLLTPPTLEKEVFVEHTNEVVLLDKNPYARKLPLVEYGVPREFFRDFEDIPPPRADTLVLNIKEAVVETRTEVETKTKELMPHSKLTLRTNYTTMRSQFALRSWVPKLSREKGVQGAQERELLLQYVLPVGGVMITETADGQILMEERGKVEIPGKYHPAPAGGCETRDEQAFPEPFRSIQGEAWEETALLPGRDYGTLTLVGIVRDQTEAFNPTFIYYAKTNLLLETVRKNADSIAPEAGEHQRLFGAPVSEELLLDFCAQNSPRLIGNGLGSLLALGHGRYGPEWLSHAEKLLGEQGWEIITYSDRFPHRRR